MYIHIPMVRGHCTIEQQTLDWQQENQDWLQLIVPSVTNQGLLPYDG